jgi:MFS family permease
MDLLTRIREEMALEGNVWKSYAYRFLMNFQLWWPIWVIYLQRSRGLSLTQITLLDTPFFLLIVLAEVPTGAIADRFGRRVSLMLASAMLAVAVFVFGIADNYFVILISYSAWGLAQTFQSGADGAILYDSLKLIGREDDFQKIIGRLWAVTSLAVLVAILIGAPIAAATSLSFPIMLSAGIALLAVPVAFSMHEPAISREEHEPYTMMVLNGIREVWRKPALRYMVAFSAIIFAATFTPLIFVQPYLSEHGVGTGDLGFWQAPVRLFGVISALGAYRFVSRVGQAGALLALPVALAVCNLALAGVDHVIIYAAFLPMGLVAGMQNPVIATYVNRRIPSERRATILSVLSVAGSMLLAVAEPAGGLLADWFGLRATFLAFGVFTATLGSITFALWLRADSAAGVSAEGLLREPAGEPVGVS